MQRFHSHFNHESPRILVIIIHTGDNIDGAPNKIRRSSIPASTERVLPRECIFHLASTSKLCGKSGLKFFRNKHSGSRQQEKLSQCLTKDAERRLCEAAIESKDENLLMHIRNKDLIAIEVCYHKSCYSSYIQLCKSQVAPTALSASTQDYFEAFQLLAKEVEEKIILQEEVMKLSKLKDKYIQLMQSRECNIPLFRSENLKAKLVAHFGSKIAFWRPKKQNKCELVYSNVAPKDTLLEATVDSCSSQSEISADSDIDSSQSHKDPLQYNDIRDLYHAAQILRESLSNTTNCLNWPPTNVQLNEKNVDDLIPCHLHNFLAYLISPTPIEFSCQDNVKVLLPMDIMVRLESIAQDIIFAHYQGRLATPKHVALGVTTRHLTNNVQLLSILNKFGHSISHTYLRELETAIAEKVVETDSVLPEAINSNQYTTAVWDNIDLAEETLTGKGTTHNTNGILVQRKLVVDTPSCPEIKRTGRRSFVAPMRPVASYYQAKRTGPEVFNIDPSLLQENRKVAKAAQALDLAWLLLRYVTMNDFGIQQIPSWSGFNAIQRADIPHISTVGYLPVIPSSSTELSTVYTLLLRTMEICSKLDQDEIVVVLDQAIYSKAIHILWKEREKFSKIVLRLGAFHTTCVMLSVVGKRFREAGLEDVLIESGVLATGSVNGVMTGKHYNRSTRIFKLVYEALHRMRWLSFMDSFDEAQAVVVQNTIHQLGQLHIEPQKTVEYVTTTDFQELQTQYEDFCMLNQSPMFSFWSSFIDIMQHILNFIRATRIGDFELHLSSLRSMLPWMFAYDRRNYMRYASIYWMEMIGLPDTHPMIAQMLYGGEFAVQRSAKNPFGQIACDMAIEQTFNKDTKSQGGIIGFSLNTNAVERWTLTSPQRAAIVEQCRQLAGMNESNVWHHKDDSRMCHDEKDVNSIMETIVGFIDPFVEENDALVHITAGYVPTLDIQSDLLQARDVGNEAFLKFVKERLLTDEIEFFAPIKSLKLKTFKSVKKVVKVSPSLNVQEDHNLFSSILVINNNLNRKINLQDLFEYSLGTYPYALATPSGCLVKTCKSKLLQILEKDHEPIELARIADKNPAWIFDGMAVVQQLVNCQAQTFGEFASHTLAVLLSITKTTTCRRIDFVTDRYIPLSIKSMERQKRSATGNIRVKILGASQKKPMQWKKFLANDDNKNELIEFLFDEWRKPQYTSKLHGVTLVVAHGEQCHSITSNGVESSSSELPELCCTHEEADTRIFLHAKHASRDHPCIVIRSPDTDVAVIGMSLSQYIPASLYLDIGVRNKRRIIDITNIAISMETEMATALIGFHAFTGCDSVSSFYGKGKTKCFGIFIKDSASVNAMNLVGLSPDINEALCVACEKFVCKLYGSQTTTSVNQLRCDNFKRTKVKSGLLPPNRDSLCLHIRRANYQAFIWRNALVPKPHVPSPSGHGWNIHVTEAEKSISITWMNLPPAPRAIMELMSCHCKKDCSTKVCQCRKNAMKCTEACGCVHCINQGDVVSSSDTDGDSDEDADL